MNDSRRSPRAPIRHRIWCESDDVTLYVRTLNASHEGLFVRTPSPVAVGRRLRVAFEDPSDGTEVIAEAEVVWSREGGVRDSGMGIRFVRFAKGREDYLRFVERQLAHSSSAGVLPAAEPPLGPRSVEAVREPASDRWTGT